MKKQTVQPAGARLYVEIHGSGPTLLLIPGGNGDAGFYRPLVTAIADRYQVVAYDRRGFSRSPLDGPLADDRLTTDSSDADVILRSLSDGPAFVFGSSSGALVALDLVSRFPDRVQAVVVHEPPAVSLLPDGEQLLAFFDDVYELYSASGLRVAMQKFAAEAGGGPPSPRTAEFWRMATLMPRLRTNLSFWFEHELRQYTRYIPDIETLQQHSTKIVLAGGRDSRSRFPYRPNTVLASHLGLNVVDFPGGHVGYRESPDEFAAKLDRILSRDVERA